MMELRAEKISRDFLRQSAAEGFFMALQETDFRLSAGSLVEVTGRSGSGKSTLLSILSGLMKPGTGQVFLDDRELYQLDEAELARLRNRHIGLVPQRLMALSSLTVWENILLPRLLYEEEESVLPYAAELMERLGIKGLKGAYPQELSGGELRRVTIARAMACRPEILLMDEPTGDLDDESTHHVLSLLREAADNGHAVLLVTHEQEAARYADRLYKMTAGKLTLQEG